MNDTQTAAKRPRDFESRLQSELWDKLGFPHSGRDGGCMVYFANGALHIEVTRTETVDYACDRSEITKEPVDVVAERLAGLLRSGQ